MGLDTRLVPRRVGSVPPISNFLPGRRFALLLMPAGPTLWQHGVLPFGADSSVWCSNRCVDALAFLARTFLDDFDHSLRGRRWLPRCCKQCQQ